MWIPGHSDFTGNAKTNELAKLGSEAAYIGPEPTLGMAHGEAKKSITEWCYQEHSDIWLRTTELVHSKEFIRGPSKNRTNNLLQLSRPHLRAVTAQYTGHCQLRAHMHRIGLAEDAECRWCMDLEFWRFFGNWLYLKPAVTFLFLKEWWNDLFERTKPTVLQDFNIWIVCTQKYKHIL